MSTRESSQTNIRFASQMFIGGSIRAKKFNQKKKLLHDAPLRLINEIDFNWVCGSIEFQRRFLFLISGLEDFDSGILSSDAEEL